MTRLQRSCQPQPYTWVEAAVLVAAAVLVVVVVTVMVVTVVTVMDLGGQALGAPVVVMEKEEEAEEGMYRLLNC